MEQLAEVQVLRLTMELALVRAEAGDTMQADDHWRSLFQKKGTFHSQFLMFLMRVDELEASFELQKFGRATGGDNPFDFLTLP